MDEGGMDGWSSLKKVVNHNMDGICEHIQCTLLIPDTSGKYLTKHIYL